MLLCQVSVRNRKAKHLEIYKSFSIKDLFAMEQAFNSAMLRGTYPPLATVWARAKGRRNLESALLRTAEGLTGGEALAVTTV